MNGRYFTLSRVCTLQAVMFSLALAGPMPPMSHIGPQPIGVDAKRYARIVHVAPDGEYQSVASALNALADASMESRCAILVAAGTYPESGIQMKPFVDLYGGFAAGDWKARDVYQNATILDGQKQGPVVLGADHARLDGFVITGGEHEGHGAGILCDGVSPTIVNNMIVGNRTLKPAWLGGGLGKQIVHEGAGIALLHGSQAYVANNLICENVTEAGMGAGISARDGVEAKILRNVFCNNTAGEKDDSEFHGKIGSRSSPGAAIACADASSPLISFNVMVLGQAVFNNDAGGVWVEGNSMPLINYNWIVGNMAYDDGGGIYVMGNLYFDETGERRDLTPDGPVTIEDNFIAGNSNVRGGPGGIRVSRWGRADLRRNTIVANPTGGAQGREGGVVAVFENNIVADNDRDTSPAFRYSGEMTGRSFDPRRYVTEISTTEDLVAKFASQRRRNRDREEVALNEPAQDQTDRLEGVAVRIGEQWSIIKASHSGRLVVWGKIDDPATTFHILDGYEKYPD